MADQRSCDPSQGAVVRIANPLSVEQDALRTSLVAPGLLESSLEFGVFLGVVVLDLQYAYE